MADNAKLIRELYDALDRHDGETMAKLYAPDGRFHDPAFGELTGAEAGDMWRMLTGRSEDLRVELAEHEADGDTGTAHWIATYTFTHRAGPSSTTSTPRFRFRDGLIVEHDDSFSFWRWARQALGPAGLVLGLPPMNLLVRAAPAATSPSSATSVDSGRASLPARDGLSSAWLRSALGQEIPHAQMQSISTTPPIHTIGSSAEKPSSLLPT